MNFLYDFFHQKVPESVKEMPVYYRKALITSEALLAVYFLLSFVLFGWASQHWTIFPLVLLAGIALCIRFIDRFGARINLGLYTLLSFLWCGWYIHTFGWNLGSQHFLIPILVLSFFNIYEPPWLKIVYFMVLVAFRLSLFYHAQSQTPIITLDQGKTIFIQTINSLVFFTNLSTICVLLSTNMQDAERELLLVNQELHKEAGTDPLTQLPNRRAMMNEISQHLSTVPDEMYCIAIADIDFFKKVNDTYGHNCGDYTLKTLAARFREFAENGNYKVCRWGGEEFCFFLPGMNIDNAGTEMNMLCVNVAGMPLHFEDVDFTITITIGVGECDYQSPVEVIIKEADEKLYMGKNMGRNRVIA